MGRLIGTTTSYSFLTSRSFTNAYTYDAASNRTGFTDPENGATTYTYDTLNRLTTLAPPSAFSTGSFGFTYDALSRRTQITRPNSVATNYTYDNLSRLLSVLHQLSGSTIDGASYTLDAAGNGTAKTDQRAAVTSNYTYDAIYQLTQVMQGANTTESSTYDPVGNPSIRSSPCIRGAPQVGFSAPPTKDQCPYLLAGLYSTDWPSRSRNHLPAQLESSPMPSDYRLWGDHDMSIFPSGPEPSRQDPEEFIEYPESWSGAAPFQCRELLPKNEVFK